MFVEINTPFSVISQVNSCPHCTSAKFIKYGKYLGVPRFMCKCCKRTFSSRTNTPWYYSKKSDEDWKLFCHMLINGESLACCAMALKINIATAFFWRHKILRAVKSVTDPESLSKHIFMFNYFIKESFKGSRKSPCYPREKLWVIMSADTCDNNFSLPYCKNSWNKSAFEKNVYTKFEAKAYISTSGNNYLRGIALQHNKKLKLPSDVITKDTIMNFLFTYKKIMSQTRGVATKYLIQYFALAKLYCLNRKFNISSILCSSYNSEAYIKSHNIKTLSSI